MAEIMADYYATLGVSRNASQAQIKEAYLRLARENHPDRFHDSEKRMEAVRRFQEITESYNHLRDERLRREHDRSLQRELRTPEEEAELYYKNGKLREEMAEYQEALKLYHEAMRLEPENTAYIMAAASLVARDHAKQRQAAELFNKAISQNPTDREAYLALGELYTRSGLLLRACRIYEAGLKQLQDDVQLKARLSEAKAAADNSKGR
ncbi:MAG: DnaJ domain-containing protein [Acidobacteriota bacterium]